MNFGSHNLHGNAPDESKVALLLIDVVNALDFVGAEALRASAEAMAPNIAALKDRARRNGIPCIFVNDNFGRWQSDFRAVLDHCLRPRSPGRTIVELLTPRETDYFVLKPKHSGFYSTTLQTLLRYLGVDTLILTGMAANNCVLFTANDAFLRDYRLVIPFDCIASGSTEDTEYALRHMRDVLKADVRSSSEVDFEELMERDRTAKK